MAPLQAGVYPIMPSAAAAPPLQPLIDLSPPHTPPPLPPPIDHSDLPADMEVELHQQVGQVKGHLCMERRVDMVL